MPVTTDHLIGLGVGISATALGFYLYRKNQNKIDAFLRSHGLDVPVNEGKPLKAMSLEELAVLKERIEDEIAEREQAEEEARRSEEQATTKNSAEAPA